MSMIVRRLSRTDGTSSFDCGDEALNAYLIRYAFQNQERHRVGVTYVAVTDELAKSVLGYYTLASATVPRDAFPADSGRRISPYADVPCLLLARLAVDRGAQGRGLGQLLLRDALTRALRVGEDVGCRGVLVDAYASAVSWYAQFGFIPLAPSAAESPAQKLFLDLRLVERGLRPK